MKEFLIAALVFAVLAVFWGTQYVAPKTRTLDAAAVCTLSQGYTMNPKDNASRMVFDQCLVEAEAKHGTALLRAIGR